MPKKQYYNITYSAPQSSVEVAMAYVGSRIQEEVIDLIRYHYALGGIQDISSTLSADGLVLDVERSWTDQAYNSLIEISSVESIINDINSIDIVTNVEYGFIDM